MAPEPSAGPTLFLLAGYPAAGKSTLLRRCLGEAVPLFGEEHGARTRRFAIHPGLEPALGSGADANHDSWNGYVDLPQLRRLGPGLGDVILHVDLVNMLLVAGEARLEELPDLSLQDLRDRYAALLGDPFLRGFPCRVVGTLWTPHAVASRRWLAREGSADSGRIALLFDPASAASRRLHRRLYRAWHLALPALSPSRHWELRMRGDWLERRRRDVAPWRWAHRRPRRHRLAPLSVPGCAAPAPLP